MARLDWRRARPPRTTVDRKVDPDHDVLDPDNPLARRAALAMRRWQSTLDPKKRRRLEQPLCS
jgi:hypothetical protein